MKRWILAALIGLSSVALADNAAILEQLKVLQQQVLQQQQQIEVLQKQLAGTPVVSQEDVSRMVEAEVQDRVDAQGLAQMKDVGSMLMLGDGVDGLKLTGDLRLRWGTLDIDNPGNLPDSDADGLMTRFRLGLVWTNSAENWEVGAGLATGHDIAFGTGESNAAFTDDIWSLNGPFETGDIYLDYAYAKHTWQDMGMTLTLGQQKNPFAASWLLWDSDVRPAGATAQYDSDGVFVTAGAYDVFQYGNNMGALYAGQIGYDLECEGFDFLVAAAYYHFNGNANKMLGRPNTSYEWRIGDLYAEGSMAVGDAVVSAYGDVFMNFGADGNAGQGLQGGTLDPDDEDLGWVLGAGVAMGPFSVGYAYAQVGADSLVPALSDFVFGLGVAGSDLEGHVINVDYSVTDNFSLGFEADIYEALERSNQAEANVYLLEFNYMF